MRSIPLLWRRTCRVRFCRQLITVSITALHDRAMAMGYALNQTLPGLNVKAARCPDSHSPGVASRLLAFGDFGSHHVTSLKAVNAFRAGQMAAHTAITKTAISTPSALTGLVTLAFRPISPRQCQQPAPALARCDQDLRTFTFVQHDQDLAEQRTEEAFAGASKRPVTNVADWLPLCLLQPGFLDCSSSSTLQGGVVDFNLLHKNKQNPWDMHYADPKAGALRASGIQRRNEHFLNGFADFRWLPRFGY